MGCFFFQDPRAGARRKHKEIKKEIKEKTASPGRIARLYIETDCKNTAQGDRYLSL